MVINMTVDEIWNAYKKLNPEAGAYEAWSFCGGGEMGDILARLVLDGTKTATASAYDVYALDDCPVPAPGSLSVVLWSDGEAACILRTTDVTVAKFRDVTPEHAYLEGEDDRSLEMWRQEHQKYFTWDLQGHGLSFSDDMPVVCERFEIVFRA
jgi:uncharacterized protein YhfF